MRFVAIAGAVGLALLIGITLHFGWQDIVEAVRQVGWGVALVFGLPNLMPILVDVFI